MFLFFIMLVSAGDLLYLSLILAGIQLPKFNLELSVIILIGYGGFVFGYLFDFLFKKKPKKEIIHI